jgi:methylated-DNA-[protein]-cysteine S-methyltransferase
MTQQNKSFSQRVKEVVQSIKEGSVLTYKEVATRAGNPNASRAVGMIMSKNYDPKIPCHRVVRTDGKMGGYNRGGSEVKMQILKKEKYINAQ